MSKEEKSGGSSPQSEVEAYLPIAQDLKKSIDAKIQDEDLSNILGTDELWDSAFREVASDLIQEALRQLPPEKILEIYAARIGDEALDKHLRRIAELQKNEIKRQARLMAIEAEARKSGILDLEKLEIGESIRLGLFDVLHTDEAYRESRIPPAREIFGRIIDPASGVVEVQTDRFSIRPGYGDATHETIPFQTRGLMGAKVTDDTGIHLEPHLTLHSNLAFEMYREGKKELVVTPEVVGFVESRDGTLLLDGFSA